MPVPDMAPQRYSEQTRINTSTDFLADQEPVDLDLDGMAEFAMNMTVIARNVTTQMADISDLVQLPMDAWNGPVLGEARFARSRTSHHYQELVTYLQTLGTALNNIGMAAQTIADAYTSTDGWSAADLEAVLFAFGDKDVAPPSGLPAGEYRTYNDMLRAGELPPADEAAWSEWDERENPDGSSTRTATGPNGQRIEITTSYAHGARTETTIIRAADGQVLSHTGVRTSGYTMAYHGGTTTTQLRDGQVVGRTVESYSTASGDIRRTTVREDATGNEVARTETVVAANDDNEVVTTTTSYLPGEAPQVTREAVGAITADPSGPASPSTAANEEIRERY
ncbi:hypothetical protein WEI85_26635 [Actinomycetes bacterium KLBMP 9797]